MGFDLDPDCSIILDRLCPGHTFTDHLAGSTTDLIPRITTEMTISGSPIRMHNASTTTYDDECNTEIYGLIRIATDDAGSYLWPILHQIRECVTWALQYSDYEKNHLKAWPMSLETPILLPAPKKETIGLHISAGVMRASDQ